jgi:hypothetical protein
VTALLDTSGHCHRRDCLVGTVREVETAFAQYSGGHPRFRDYHRKYDSACTEAFDFVTRADQPPLPAFEYPDLVPSPRSEP